MKEGREGASKQASGPDDFAGGFHQTFKDEMPPILRHPWHTAEQLLTYSLRPAALLCQNQMEASQERETMDDCLTNTEVNVPYQTSAHAAQRCKKEERTQHRVHVGLTHTEFAALCEARNADVEGRGQLPGQIVAPQGRCLSRGGSFGTVRLEAAEAALSVSGRWVRTQTFRPQCPAVRRSAPRFLADARGALLEIPEPEFPDQGNGGSPWRFDVS